MGDWADFLTREMLIAIENNYRVRKGSEHRGIFGKSSGGYGAIIHGMLYSQTWGAIACHSGDMDFDLCYRGDMADTVMHLANYEGSVSAFMDKIQSGKKMSGSDTHILMILAMAATYDPDPEAPAGVQLPVNPETCEIIDERWSQWLRHDPLHMIERTECRESLRQLRGLYIDVGFRDQFYLQYPARAFVRKLRELDIDHAYSEFDDNHSGIDYRMDQSLPFLYTALNP